MRDRMQRPLYLAFAAIVIGHTVIVGAASMWWAGHSFGPRFMTDIVPFLVFFTAFHFQLREVWGSRPRMGVTVIIALLGLVSVAIHAQGAFRPSTLAWNNVPNNIDSAPSRAWDWSDPQFARTCARFPSALSCPPQPK